MPLEATPTPVALTVKLMIPGYVGDDTESGPLVPPMPSNGNSSKRRASGSCLKVKAKGRRRPTGVSAPPTT